MKVINQKKIYDFKRKHPDSKDWLESWLAETRYAEWTTPEKVKERYVSASILSNNRVIFNVKGNKYRMEVQIAYKSKTLTIKRLGTHAEYARWDT